MCFSRLMEGLDDAFSHVAAGQWAAGVACFERAAAAGVARAMFELGRAHYMGYWQLPCCFARGIEWHRRAAVECGYAPSMGFLVWTDKGQVPQWESAIRASDNDYAMLMIAMVTKQKDAISSALTRLAKSVQKTGFYPAAELFFHLRGWIDTNRYDGYSRYAMLFASAKNYADSQYVLHTRFGYHQYMQTACEQGFIPALLDMHTLKNALNVPQPNMKHKLCAMRKLLVRHEDDLFYLVCHWPQLPNDYCILRHLKSTRSFTDRLSVGGNEGMSPKQYLTGCAFALFKAVAKCECMLKKMDDGPDDAYFMKLMQRYITIRDGIRALVMLWMGAQRHAPASLIARLPRDVALIVARDVWESRFEPDWWLGGGGEKTCKKQ